MIRGAPRLLLEAVIVIVTACSLGAVYGAWRIGHAPWKLAFLSPLIASSLSDDANSRQVTVGDAVLIWQPTERTLAIEVHDIQVHGSVGQTLATIGIARVRLSGASLVTGEIAPTEISLIDPILTVVRDTDGTFSFGLGNADATPGGRSALVDRPLSALIDTPAEPGQQRTGRFRHLKRLHIIAGHLTVDDRRVAVKWEVPNITLDLARAGPRITGEASLDLDLDGKTTRIGAKGAYEPPIGAESIGQITGNVSVDDLRLPSLASRIPALADAVALDAPLDIDATVAMTANGKLTDLAAVVHANQGQLNDARLPIQSVKLSELSARLHYSAIANQIVLEQAEVSLTNPTDQVETLISGSATITDPADRATLQGTLKVSALPIQDLKSYWPRNVSVGARQWILANMTHGTIGPLSMKFAGSRAGAGAPILQGPLDGTLEINDARVSYFGQLPAAEHVSGSATFNAARFDIQVKSGICQNQEIQGGTIAITGLDGDDHRIAIDLHLAGKVADALTVIDSQPLGYMKRFGITPGSIGGDAVIELTMAFPLVHDLSVDQLRVGTSATITGLSVPAVIRQYDLTEGNFALALDATKLHMTGNGKLNGVPIAATWTESFAQAVSPRRTLLVDAVIDDDARQRFDLHIDRFATGPLDATIDYSETDDRHAKVAVFLDGRDAQAQITELGWNKPPGQDMTAQFDIDLLDGHADMLRDAFIDGGGLIGQISGKFKPAGGLSTVDIKRLSYGDTDLHGHVAWRDAGGYDIDLSGRSLDWSGPYNAKQTTLDDNEPVVPIDIKLKLDQLVLGKDQKLFSVMASAQHSGQHWVVASIDASTRPIDGAHDVTLRLTPEANTRHLAITASDAGAMLKAVGFTDYIRNGTLKLDGVLENTRQRMTGQAELKNYRLVKAPILARLLAVASVTGIPELLTGEGIAFDNLTASFLRTREATEITEGRAAGLALGLTAAGKIDRLDGAVDLSGTIVPIYSASRIVGAIPLLGNLLTGGEGGGLFAWTYTVKGPPATAEVSVNALSILAPGILRSLFDHLTSSTPATPPAPEPTQ